MGGEREKGFPKTEGVCMKGRKEAFHIRVIHSLKVKTSQFFFFCVCVQHQTMNLICHHRSAMDDIGHKVKFFDFISK